LDEQALATLRGQVADIIAGTVFVFVGLAACGIAAMRRRSGVRVLVWLGIWSAMYGALRLSDSLPAVARLPHGFQVGANYVDAVLTYLILVVATRAFLELSLGKMRFILQAVIVAGLAIGLAGIAFFLFTGVSDKLMPYNNLLAACLLLVLITVVAVPRLAHKFLVTPNSKVLLVGTLVFALEALYTNVLGSSGRHRQVSVIWDSMAFAAFLFSIAYVALQMVFASERRLLAIENELAIAREIQASILPRSVPEVSSLRIAAAYHPMTAVAGDFYEFIPLDQHRVGFLVADVTGHGVPAALIAAMIKVAVQSVVPCAQDPREVLRGLNRILSGQLRDQFVTAAYFWLDTETRKALYSAAGHPPLLRWRDGSCESIVSNGLLFGVHPDSDYPVREISLHPGDRFLLYTDGVVEPENAQGESFGERKLDEIIRASPSLSPSTLLERLFSEIRRWQPASLAQQDDITLIAIDVV
jgi:phosphoserine phosphatase RsbU/P